MRPRPTHEGLGSFALLAPLRCCEGEASVRILAQSAGQKGLRKGCPYFSEGSSVEQCMRPPGIAADMGADGTAVTFVCRMLRLKSFPHLPIPTTTRPAVAPNGVFFSAGGVRPRPTHEGLVFFALLAPARRCEGEVSVRILTQSAGQKGLRKGYICVYMYIYIYIYVYNNSLSLSFSSLSFSLSTYIYIYPYFSLSLSLYIYIFIYIYIYIYIYIIHIIT